MSESSSSFSSLTLLLLIIFLLVLLCPSLSSSSESEVRVLDRELLEIKTNPKLNKTSRKPKCCEMRTRSQCSGFPRCRWCRSEALDDLCFGKAEALRLPSQVFRSLLVVKWLTNWSRTKAKVSKDLVKTLFRLKKCLVLVAIAS
ncbi:hypothetical protein DY000_02008944 [Brassica cretica]|uniref:Uncharacterized protein n=1 Tax=Brassica cretica TaxID=69181 RepID=A0ABQ7BXK6_BRACR|nr:hypothetical protein DY000_02008944 [Brassica cretica]